MNAVRAERIHQAYLFTGSRGIGKTSISRIFAKVIRCEQTSFDGTWLRSCDECSSCREISLGTSVDVIEIDGASNNGVDAIREIRESAKYMPASGKRKIYIIDEVHMLTTAAFNALLKTLEEPPAHVIFIFATTEPHKIPPTILSRCQRFDYRRVTLAQIQTRLTQVTAAEGIQAEPGALALIGRAAEGSMRDALSLLDQVIAFSGTNVTTQSVRESVGLIAGQALISILRGVFARQPLEALAVVDHAYQQGHDLRVLTRSLLELIHGTILAKVGAGPSALLELSEEETRELQELSELRSLEEMELIFQVLHHGLDWIARSPQPKIVLDVLLVKCATAEALVSVSESTGTNSAGGAGIAQPGLAQASRTEAPSKVKIQTAATTAATMTAAGPAAAAVSTTATATAPQLQPSRAATTTAITPSLTPQPAANREPTATATATVTSTANAKSPPSWEGLIAHVRKTRPLLASILEHSLVGGLPTETENRVLIQFAPDAAYYRDQLQSKTYSEQLLNFCKDYFGRPVGVKLEIKNTSTTEESVAARRARETKEKMEAARNAVRNHPIIQEARALFGGELGNIELSDSGGEYGAHHE